MTLDQGDQKAGAQQIDVERGSRGDDFVSVGRDRKRPLDVVENIEARLASCEGELARVRAVADPDFALRVQRNPRAVSESDNAALPRPGTVELRALRVPDEERSSGNGEDSSCGGQRAGKGKAPELYRNREIGRANV